MENRLADVPEDEGRVVLELEVIFRGRGEFVPDSVCREA